MSKQDIVVGSVALLMGLVALGCALRKEPLAYDPPPVRWARARWGQQAAQVCYGLIGLVLIALGCVIFVGFTFPWQR